MITTGWQRLGWGRRAGSCPARNTGILAVPGRRLPIMNALTYYPSRAVDSA